MGLDVGGGERLVSLGKRDETRDCLAVILCGSGTASLGTGVTFHPHRRLRLKGTLPNGQHLANEIEHHGRSHNCYCANCNGSHGGMMVRVADTGGIYSRWAPSPHSRMGSGVRALRGTDPTSRTVRY